MQRKVVAGSVSFYRSLWANYRDGFGSAAGNDNYWLGLDKVYRLMQLGGVRLRVEVGLEENKKGKYRSFLLQVLWMVKCQGQGRDHHRIDRINCASKAETKTTSPSPVMQNHVITLF